MSALCLCTVENREQSKHFFNFYYSERILTHLRLPQGWSASPNIAQKAMDRTFDDRILLELIKRENLIEDDRFPFKKYDDFTMAFVDYISIFSKKNLKKESHFLCVKAVLFTLKLSGWLLSLEKCSFFAQNFIFLGCTWEMN